MNRSVLGFGSGAAIGLLGGLIGLGGAEFRLPVLVGWLGMTPRSAVPMNLVVSLITLSAALIGRASSLSLVPIQPHVPEIAGLIAGGLVSAIWGAGALSKLSDRRLSRILAALLTGIGLLLVVESALPNQSQALIPSGLVTRAVAGVLFGLLIGAIAALLGVAGGEMLIPTFIFAFGADIATAGTASILVSMVLVLAALVRYGQLKLLPGRANLRAIAIPMGSGSILGAIAGGLMIGLIAPEIFKLGLGIILIVSAVRTFKKVGH
ncbi:MAG: sulfite exporter TauE/SafE family protein [Ferrovibrio sp.]